MVQTHRFDTHHAYLQITPGADRGTPGRHAHLRRKRVALHPHPQGFRPAGAKYEADGGPGWIDIARILQQSESRQQDLRTLLLSQLLFWLMAATDGHAKNFSIFLLPGGRYRLTPLYDVLSAWPVTGTGPGRLDRHKSRLSMASGGAHAHYRWRDIQRRHFNHTAHLCGWGTDMEDLITEVLDRLPSALAQAQADLPEGFPGQVFESIAAGMTDSAQRLGRMPRD